MTPSEALYLLGLDDGANRGRVRDAYDAKRVELLRLQSNAPTESLRSKYQAELDELARAFHVLQHGEAPLPIDEPPPVAPAARFPALKVVIAGALAGSLLVMLLSTSVLTRAWQAVWPGSAASEHEKAAALLLQEKVSAALTALDAKHSKLQSQLTEAKWKQGRSMDDVQRLTANLQKIEKNLLQVDGLATIHSEFAVAQRLIVDEDYAQAVAHLEPLESSLQQRLDLLGLVSQIETETVNLQVDFDGTYVWDGEVQSLQQLEERFAAEAEKRPQPKVLLILTRRAPDKAVDQLIAAAQSRGIRGLELAPDAESAPGISFNAVVLE